MLGPTFWLALLDIRQQILPLNAMNSFFHSLREILDYRLIKLGDSYLTVWGLLELFVLLGLLLLAGSPTIVARTRASWVPVFHNRSASR